MENNQLAKKGTGEEELVVVLQHALEHALELMLQRPVLELMLQHVLQCMLQRHTAAA